MPDLARDLALDVLKRVETRGAFANASLRAAFNRHPAAEDRDRSLTTELVYGVLRRRGQLDRAIGALGRRLKDLDPKIHDVLRLAAYQLLFLDRVPDHAAVSVAVDQAKGRGGPRAGGQVNAILRKLSALPRDSRLPAPPPFEADPARHLAEAYSLPRSMAEMLLRDLGPDDARRYAEISLERAPLTLRVNALRTTRDDIVREIGGTPGAHPLSVHLPARAGALPIDLLPVAEGRATPQDEGSMRVVDLLDPQPGDRVLDVCAAPGGKTTHIAERMLDKGEVVAHDRAIDKLPRIEAAARRLQLSSIHTAEVLPALSDPPFDRVLVDAPCSGLGTLRRHPELRWRFRPEDLDRLIAIQRQVLTDGAARVRPGGVLVYSVCTVTRAESEAVLEDSGVLASFDVAERLRTAPDEPGAPDGFFAVKLVRR